MHDEKLLAAVEDTRSILREHKLCDHCIGRMFAGKLGVTSHQRLGKKIRGMIKQSQPRTCFICKTLMSDTDKHVMKMLEASKGYQFSTFLIGAILQPSIHDRDDVIRSRFRLRGITSIKSDLTREIGKKFSRKTGISVDYHNPDMVFTMDFKKDYCEIKPKSIQLQARYTKKVRGLPQKQKPCDNCSGKGCFACDFHGIREFESVEGKIAKFLIDKFGAQQAKLTWIGGEDESSLVLGSGRPFFARLVNPHKRRIRVPGTVDLGGVLVHGMRAINKIPSDPVRFRTVTVMEIESEGEVAPDLLEGLRMLRRQQIVLHENSHRQKKMIYNIRPSRIGDNLFRVRMESDGGIPLKRFVSGQDVEPSISEILEVNCRCRQFDFQKIIVAR